MSLINDAPAPRAAENCRDFVEPAALKFERFGWNPALVGATRVKLQRVHSLAASTADARSKRNTDRVAPGWAYPAR